MWIELKNFKLKTLIGVHEQERQTSQELTLNLKIRTDAQKAIVSDSITDTLDYEKLHQQILELAQRSRYALLESLVHQIEQLVLQDPKALEVLVEVEKPNILKDCEAILVRN
ncbi:MAG: dihydroneopterin aldolase [Deltaproteobacteria bacterium]|nr:dihydroneopterin aldolase [Deltaproteobacteria bacterium]